MKKTGKGFRIIVIECDSADGKDTMLAALRELLGERPCETTRIEISSPEPQPETPPPPRFKVRESVALPKEQSPTGESPARVPYAKPFDPNSMSGKVRQAISAARGEDINVPELARDCYGDSTKESIGKLRRLIYQLCHSGQLIKIGHNAWKLTE